MDEQTSQKLKQLDTRYKNLMRLYIATILISVIAFSSWGFTSTNNLGIIRVKGLIVEDENGRDRILIGAPIPNSKHRVRTDTAKVRKYWAKTYEEMENNYMDWYKNYKHSAEGIVIMNEEGFDRVLIGDKLADPNIGKRRFELSGMVWNDKQGWELGGAGVNTSRDGKARSVIGVDNEGAEAVHLIALEDGTKGIVINGENGKLLIGMSNPKGQLFRNEEKFSGIKYFDNNGKLRWEQRMDTLLK